MTANDDKVVNATSFCQSLCSVLPVKWEEECPEEGASAWTGYMAEKLFKLAAENDLGVCSHLGQHAPTNLGDATKSKGWAREFLFDFTLYENWTNYAQPVVIIEHENNWNTGAFMMDFWKLMLG